jgi:Rrf2 family nitric oxide-sensitive transcriptional repressor
VIVQAADYALRAIVDLAGRPEGARTIAPIAEATCAPAGYLAKVMQNLGRARLVKSQRGHRGGFSLAPRARRAFGPGEC